MVSEAAAEVQCGIVLTNQAIPHCNDGGKSSCGIAWFVTHSAVAAATTTTATETATATTKATAPVHVLCEGYSVHVRRVRPGQWVRRPVELLPGLLRRSIYVINKIWDCELAHNSALRAVVTTAHGNLGLNRLKYDNVENDFFRYIRISSGLHPRLISGWIIRIQVEFHIRYHLGCNPDLRRIIYVW